MQLSQLVLRIKAISPKLRWVQRRASRHWLPSAFVVFLLLGVGVTAFTVPLLHVAGSSGFSDSLRNSMYGLVWLVSLAGVYILVRQVEYQRIQGRLVERNAIFQLITENAADMIAVVDVNGNRLYNSPSYETVLGYSPDELVGSWAFEQIHPDDRERVISVAQQASFTGTGQRVEYRVRHKDGSWRVLESTASAVRNPKGEVEKFVIVNRDITERKRVEQQLEHNALHDTLTDLPNRILFLDCLQRAFDRAKKNPQYQFAVLFVDIDGFKAFNDSMGHSVGDQLIVKIARRLTASLRYEDTVSRPTLARSDSRPADDGVLARLGGDEFTILLGGISHPTDALRVARRIQHGLGVPIEIDGQEVFTSASIGVALSATPHDSAADMLRDADIAMYRAKALGKARSEIFDSEMHSNAVKRLKIETDLHKALDRKELEVYYQPLVCLQTRRIVGFEALVRWNHPEDGFLVPGKFIPVAEETGLIIPMNRWVLRESCRTVQTWNLQYAAEVPLTIAVNVSARQLTNPSLVREVELVLQETRLSPRSLHLEITESIAMSDPQTSRLTLSRLKSLGVRISIDDFGTGHSSLSRLRQFPADVLKVDRSFVARLRNRDNEDRDVVRMILMLAHSLHLSVVAEGIETEEQLDSLIDLGCEFGQGYFFARPMACQGAQHFLEQSNRLSPRAARAAQEGS
jgi:PAS domain S-box-containing protein